jgi:hypothetical protein
MPQEDQRSNQERPDEPRSFAMGDHGPFKGEVAPRPDDAIRSDVESALFYDEAVSSLGVIVEVQGGTVVLRGTVSSELAKRIAEEDAWRISSVRNVRNDLQVTETPEPSRAAGEELIEAKPPEPIFGEHPQTASEAPPAGQPTEEQQRAA